MKQNLNHHKKSGAVSAINISRKERDISLVGGLTFLVIALMRPKKLGLFMGPLGLNLLYRGLTGHSWIYSLFGINRAVHDEEMNISVPHQQGIRTTSSITINRPPNEVYAFWRDFSNLPQFMPHLEAVITQNATLSHWKVRGPVGMNIEWDAEIINDVANEVIGWRSLENPYVDHAGSVRFKPAPANQGTEVSVEMEYLPIGGKISAVINALVGTSPEQQIRDALIRLKQVLEVGEIATIEEQTSARLT